MIGHIGLVSHHLQSLLGAVELTVLCAFVCKVIYLDAQIRSIMLYKVRGFELDYLRKCK